MPFQPPARLAAAAASVLAAALILTVASRNQALELQRILAAPG